MIEPCKQQWTAADATDLYEIERWGKEFFSVGEQGRVQLHGRATGGGVRGRGSRARRAVAASLPTVGAGGAAS